MTDLTVNGRPVRFLYQHDHRQGLAGDVRQGFSHAMKSGRTGAPAGCPQSSRAGRVGR